MQRFHETLHETNTIQTHINEFNDLHSSDEGHSSSSDNEENEENVESANETIEDKTSVIMYNQLIKLKTKFDLYCSQLSVFGFNNSNYDIPLIKSKLAK